MTETTMTDTLAEIATLICQLAELDPAYSADQGYIAPCSGCGTPTEGTTLDHGDWVSLCPSCTFQETAPPADNVMANDPATAKTLALWAIARCDALASLPHHDREETARAGMVARSAVWDWLGAGRHGVIAAALVNSLDRARWGSIPLLRHLRDEVASW